MLCKIYPPPEAKIKTKKNLPERTENAIFAPRKNFLAKNFFCVRGRYFMR